MHALIIEDESLIQVMIETYLEDLGFTSFEHAKTQDEAIACARSRVPDLITADLHLAEGSGQEAARAIRTEHPVPVVLIVGDVQRVRASEFTIVEKPFTFDTLKQAVTIAMQAG